MSVRNQHAEESIRGYCDAGQFDRAATRLVEAFGGEIGRFIGGRVKNGADAQDIFGMFCEDLWDGLPGFAWRCTVRGWAYTIARHAELRYLAAPVRQRNRTVSLDDQDIAMQDRTSTAPFARTSVRDRFRDIRSRLTSEDQLILVLRVDRDLGWRDIAHVLAGPMPVAGELHRHEARIRKRFQLIKERLRRWASDDGLLAPSPGAEHAAAV